MWTARFVSKKGQTWQMHVQDVIHHLTLTVDPHVCNLTPPSHYYLIDYLYSAAWDCVLVCPGCT